MLWTHAFQAGTVFYALRIYVYLKKRFGEIGKGFKYAQVRLAPAHV